MRVTGDWDVRGVEVGRIDFAGGWNVTVAVMEFVREDPLESELRRRIAEDSWADRALLAALARILRAHRIVTPAHCCAGTSA